MRATHSVANCFDVIPIGGLFYLSIGLAEIERGEQTGDGIPYSTQIDWDRVYLMSIVELKSLRDMLVKLVDDIEGGKVIVTPLIERAGNDE